MYSFLDDFLSLIYPRICMACGSSLYKQEEVVCTRCLFHLPKTYYHLQAENPVSQNFWGRVQVEAAASFYYFNKGSHLQQLIHQLKYKGEQEIGRFLGRLYGRDLRHAAGYKTIDVIVPVPLHPIKQKQRGYNQSTLFARGLSESMHRPVNDSNLIRSIASETQTKKSRFNRWENVKAIFTVLTPETFAGKHILLVDDVVTTGATIEACAQTLQQIPEVKISVATIATPQH